MFGVPFDQDGFRVLSPEGRRISVRVSGIYVEIFHYIYGCWERKVMHDTQQLVVVCCVDIYVLVVYFTSAFWPM